MLQINIYTLVIILLLIAFVIIAYANYLRRKTNKKLSEANKKLFENEQKYKIVVESSPNIMFIQKNGKILFANSTFINTSGYRMEELIGMSIFDLVSKRDRTTTKKRSELRLEGKEVPNSYEIETKNKSGIIKYFHINVSKTIYNGEEALLGIGTDITSQKQYLETINTLSAAIEQSNAAVVIFDINGTIVYNNQAFCELSGYKTTEANGMNIRRLNPDNFRISESEEFWKHIMSGKKWYGEFQSSKKNGELYWESAQVAPIFNSDGKITHFSSITRDITKEKTFFKQLEKSEAELQEANATKDRFFSIIAHDLKNPFNAIMGYTELLVSQYEKLDKEDVLDYIENINLATHSTFNLLENILEWSRSQMGKIDFLPHEFDLSKVINEVILLSRAQAIAKNIRLLSKVKHKTYVYADDYMVKTVIRNLVSNAIKFTKKGEVIVETEEFESKVMVSVIDTGVGIKDEIFDKLFKLDSNIKTSGTNSEKGTGLGLILAKEFINKNGGDIWVNRMKDQGTIFNFTLPTKE
ncbi:MAG: hypothetical protein C0595_14850 [Marinilabiliales bacterium]|nr:MAG: hypothetical protein C0595_14850 [Marinilabiliales bacterium]